MPLVRLKGTSARLLLATLTLIGGAAFAGPGAWTSGGPYGGPVVPLVVDPSNPANLYAGTDSGVFRSTDFGTTWARTSLSNQKFHSLVIDAAPAPTIYAVSNEGGHANGVHKSTDSGSTWSAVNNPPPGPMGFGFWKRAQALAVDPTSPATLYSAYIDDGFSYSIDAFKSTNSGATWERLPPSFDTYGLAVDPATPSTVFAVGFYELFRSTNAGSNWASLDLPVNFLPRALALDPLTPGTLYVGSLAGQGSNRLIKSTDAGNSFGPAGAGLPNTPMHALVVDPTTPSRLYASTDSGVFESTDSGGTWSLTGLASPTNTVAIDPATPATLYATTTSNAGPDIGERILKSTDAGVTWAAATAGVTDADILSLAVRAAPPAVIYAGTKGQGLFKSTDSGSSWVLALGPSASFDSVGAIAIDPTNPATVYAGADGVHKSTDSGVTWSAPTGSIQVSALAIDPVTPTTLYAGGSTPLEKSTDGGVTWNPSAGYYAYPIVIDPSSPAIVYAGTGGGVIKSTNAGFTWSLFSAGMGTHTRISALVLDPATPATLYAAGSDSQPSSVVFKSTNAGATWIVSHAGISTDVLINALVIDPNETSTLYAAGSYAIPNPYLRSSRVFKSTNGGVGWTSVKRGLPETFSIDSLALDPTGATTLYAGLRMGSVWQASPPPTFAKGDMDDDGRPDLVFRSNVDGAHNKVWFMDGVTRAAEADITPDAQSADWKIRGVDDFNSDAMNDLVTWNQVTGNVEFWLMNGTARTGAPVPLSGAPVLNTGWDLSATADFNFDGLPDIVWRNFTSQKIVIWTMNGTAKGGAIIPTPDQAVNGNWIIVAALDYNHDVNPDFLWYNFSSGKLVTWYMDASVVRTTGQFTTPDAAGNNNWKVLASGDYSREYVPGTPPLGSPDIVWRNETSGNQVVWHMDFTSSRVHGQFTNPAANTPALDWTIVGPR